MKNTLQPIIEQQEKEKKSSKGLIFNDQISIKRIEAGYNPHNSEGIWVPCVAIMFKNISNRDIAQYIKITVIFINNTKEEQMDTDYQYLATSSRIFISGTTKQLPFSSSTGWYGATRGLDVTARIYVDDELVLTKKIPTGEFDGMIR